MAHPLDPAVISIIAKKVFGEGIFMADKAQDQEIDEIFKK